MKKNLSVFNAYSRYYDLLYQDKDYAGEVDYIARIMARHGIVQGNLLEFGSGTGKHGRLLGGRGFQVHGIERSAEMVAQAALDNNFTCQSGDICTIKMDRSFDAVLSFFHVISYQTSNSSVQAVFERAAEHLQSDGLFIFDFWYSPAVYTQRPVVRVKHMIDATTDITRLAEPISYPNENRVDVNYTIYARDLATGVTQTLSETHSMRHFSLPEIDFLAKLNGFTRIGVEEFLTGRPVSEDTWGVCVILRKA